MTEPHLDESAAEPVPERGGAPFGGALAWVSVVGALLGALLLAYNVAGHFWPRGGPAAGSLGGQRVVVFDVVKLANSQRKVASALLGRNASQGGDQAALLLDIQERTRDVIREVAGEGTIVLVKQAVIHTELADITDEVLVKLRLPTDAPTQNLEAGGMDYAPTLLGMTPRPGSLSDRNASDNVLAGQREVLP